jgi:hypothetical protein
MQKAIQINEWLFYGVGKNVELFFYQFMYGSL